MAAAPGSYYDATAPARPAVQLLHGRVDAAVEERVFDVPAGGKKDRWRDRGRVADLLVEAQEDDVKLGLADRPGFGLIGGTVHLHHAHGEHGDQNGHDRH